MTRGILRATLAIVILEDPGSVVSELTDLPLSADVLEDATRLVETLTNPEALLEALADPATLLEGLADPEAALDALARATGAVEPPEEGATEPAEPTTEQLAARLRRLIGI